MKFSTLKQTIASLTLVALISSGSAFATPQYTFDSVNKAFIGLLKTDHPTTAEALKKFNKELITAFENITDDKKEMPYPERLEILEQKLKEFYLLFIAPLEGDPAIVANPAKQKILDAVKKLHADFLARVAIFNQGKKNACHGSITVSYPLALAIAAQLKAVGYAHLIPAEHKKRAASEASLLTKLQNCLKVQY